VIAEGQRYLGTPYVLGGMESCVPFEMMDCSCFTMTVFSEFGIALPDSPGGQMGYGSPVRGAPIAGDLLFWSEDGSGVITHVGIAMGDGTTIHASTYTGSVTQGTPIDSLRATRAPAGCCKANLQRTTREAPGDRGLPFCVGGDDGLRRVRVLTRAVSWAVVT
jgi:cell wall-associated NlpC family hydrolase